MTEMLTVDQALAIFNSRAPEHGAKPRTQFRNRAAAEKAFESIGLPKPDWSAAAPAIPVATAAANGSAQPAPEGSKLPANGAKKPEKSVSAAKEGRRPPREKSAKRSAERAVVDPNEDKLLAAFQVLKNSNHARVLKVLEEAKGKPVLLSALEKVTKTSRSATLMTIGGLIKKTKGESMRGKSKPPYTIEKTKSDNKELQIALQAK